MLKVSNWKKYLCFNENNQLSKFLGSKSQAVYIILVIIVSKVKFPFRSFWSMGHSEVWFTSFCDHGIQGDCVVSTMPSRLYFSLTCVRYPSELGWLRGTLQAREKILMSPPEFEPATLRFRVQAPYRSATVPPKSIKYCMDNRARLVWRAGEAAAD